MECKFSATTIRTHDGVLKMGTPVLQVGIFGDDVSTTLNNDQTHDGWIYQVNLSGGGKFNCSPHGFVGATAQTQLLRLNAILPAISSAYDVFGIQIWSHNNVDLVANYAAIQSAIQSAVAAIQTAGKGWFVNFLTPPGTTHSGTSAYATAWQNLRIWASAVYAGKMVDTISSVADPINPLNWAASQTSDQFLPNGTGAVSLGASATPQIKTILQNYGYAV